MPKGIHDHDHEAGDHKGHAHGGLLGPNTELIFALVCGGLLIAGYAIRLVAGALAGSRSPAMSRRRAFGSVYTLRRRSTTCE
ncbi:MAG: hypothetical protein R3F10_05920 [Lysobacteraceae bacterium]